MALGEQYIVNFSEAIDLFQKRMAADDLPTIDLDVVKWRVMEMWEQKYPLRHLELVVDDMLRHDWLYAKEEFVDTTPMRARQKKIQLNQYLRTCLIELGVNLHAKLREMGMLTSGTERYRVTLRPLDNETYTLRQTGS